MLNMCALKPDIPW